MTIESTQMATQRAAETLQELDLEPTRKAFAALAEAAGQVVKAVAAWLTSAAQILTTAWGDNLQWALAYNWAKAAHPEWVGILNRTKKRRTRKKYQDRIMRAYLEVMNRGDNQRPN